LLTLFRYNWQVRDEWFDWCETLPSDELTRQRTGSVGSILRTLFHVVDVEQAWILQGLQGKPAFHYHYEDYDSLNAVRGLSGVCRPRDSSRGSVVGVRKTNRKGARVCKPHWEAVWLRVHGVANQANHQQALARIKLHHQSGTGSTSTCKRHGEVYTV
jgi:hypothetical protein